MGKLIKRLRSKKHNHEIDDLPKLLRMQFIQRLKEGRFNPRYDGSQPAECKYCYETHYGWMLGTDYGDEIVWVCEKCIHATKDEYMQIEDVEMSEEQKAFYGKYAHLIQGQD